MPPAARSSSTPWMPTRMRSLVRGWGGRASSPRPRRLWSGPWPSIQVPPMSWRDMQAGPRGSASPSAVSRLPIGHGSSIRAGRSGTTCTCAAPISSSAVLRTRWRWSSASPRARSICRRWSTLPPVPPCWGTRTALSCGAIVPWQLARAYGRMASARQRNGDRARGPEAHLAEAMVRAGFRPCATVEQAACLAAGDRRPECEAARTRVIATR